MDYNWKYVKIKSSSALRIWQEWPSYAKINFISNHVKSDQIISHCGYTFCGYTFRIYIKMEWNCMNYLNILTSI